MDIRTSKMFRHKLENRKRRNFKYNPRSKPTIFCNVRCIQFWNWLSTFTIALNKLKLKSAISGLFLQANLRLSTPVRKCTAKIYILTEYEFSVLGSKHPTVLFTHHKQIIFFIAQKTYPNQRVYSFQMVSMKFPNSHEVWTAGKNLASPNKLSRNTRSVLLTR